MSALEIPVKMYSLSILQRWLEVNVFTLTLIPSTVNRKLTLPLPANIPAPDFPSSTQALSTLFKDTLYVSNGFQKKIRASSPFVLSIIVVQPSA